MSKCIGCGIKLQDKDKNRLGYTPNINNKYCERCFKTIHYNKKINVSIDNKIIIDNINKKKYFTFFITDLVHLNNNLINIYKKISNKKILVINKSDIIPDNLSLEHLSDNIKNVYNIKEDIIFVSSKSNVNLNIIVKLINENKNVILCGETSSGKSTIINKIANTKLTTSKYNNTTLDFIKIKFNDNNIWDSPGINLNSEYFDKVNIKTITLKQDYVLVIADIIIKGEGNITLIGNENIRAVSKKCSDNQPNKYNLDNNTDILINNFGFIYVKNAIKIECNKKLETRKSIIK